MKIVGHNISKILAEKKDTPKGKITLNTNIDINHISELNFDTITPKGKLLGVNYTLTFTYDPDFAKIELKGSFIIEIAKELAEKAIKDWETKKVDSDLHLLLTNIILQKSHLKALQLEEELGLPLHFQLPEISLKK